ncbi:MAG: adenylate/guanylate cyclase domain-containing protein [Planctomycetes bacterium]|nr:adenylate/guanylate cyclase domain-containing protein [Planctomycetota bacterium]
MKIEREIAVRAKPEQIWALIANTDSLNREIGLPSVAYALQRESEGRTQVIAKASALGASLEWIEHPFEWAAPREYVVEREFRKGPFDRIRAGVRIARDPADAELTRVTVFAEVAARGVFGHLGASLGLTRNVEQVRNAADSFAKYLNQELNTPYPRRAGKIKCDTPALEAAAQRLLKLGGDPGLCSLLYEHLRTAPEEEVVRMRAFELADRWKSERLGVLVLFLQATRAGLVDMTWNVLCPCCRVSKHEHGKLQEVHRGCHCDYCGINFDADLDRLVEIRFTVHPSIRETKGQVFCMGGPLNSPHVWAQQRLKPGERRTLELALPPARYTLRVLQTDWAQDVDLAAGAAGEAGRLSARLADGQLKLNMEDARAGRLTVELENASAAERVVRLEEQAWTDQAASAALVTTLQDFRDLFSREFLAPGEELAVRSLTFMFTDLRGSTALYEQVGDASAYVLVRDHFKVLRKHIKDRHGTVVKTMGDAVMAVFLSPLDALEAALDIQREIQAQQRAGGGAAKVAIKLGLHAGACIAVGTDEHLDYFGTTVNLAQRVQAQSEGGDLVLSQAMLERAGVRARLEQLGASVEAFSATVKGFSEPLALFRIRFAN